jgi:hypothetical protein
MSEEAGGLRGGWLRVLVAAAFAAGCTAESVPRGLPRHEPVQYVATAVPPTACSMAPRLILAPIFFAA